MHYKKYNPRATKLIGLKFSGNNGETLSANDPMPFSNKVYGDALLWSESKYLIAPFDGLFIFSGFYKLTVSAISACYIQSTDGIVKTRATDYGDVSARGFFAIVHLTRGQKAYFACARDVTLSNSSGEHYINIIGTEI
jgi:hypothetical protein